MLYSSNLQIVYPVLDAMTTHLRKKNYTMIRRDSFPAIRSGVGITKTFILCTCSDENTCDSSVAVEDFEVKELRMGHPCYFG